MYKISCHIFCAKKCPTSILFDWGFAHYDSGVIRAWPTAIPCLEWFNNLSDGISISVLFTTTESIFPCWTMSTMTSFTNFRIGAFKKISPNHVEIQLHWPGCLPQVLPTHKRNCKQWTVSFPLWLKFALPREKEPSKADLVSFGLVYDQAQGLHF